MAYKHGIYPREIPTSVVPPALSDTGLVIAIGTAPINMGNRNNVNKPVLCFSYKEAVEEFGYSDNWKDYTLSEVIYSQFSLYGQGPVVLINVLDPDSHFEEVKEKGINLSKKKLTLEEGVLPDSLIIKKGEEILENDIDYLISFKQDGKLDLIIIKDEIRDDDTLTIAYNKLAPKEIANEDIIGGIDVNNGNKLGMELISEVFPRFRKVPGILIIPGFSHNPEIAALMSAKMTNINGIFKGEVIVDAPTDMNYTEVPEWKNKNNIMNPNQLTGYPEVKLDSKIFRMSTAIAGVINTTDSNNNDVPYESPSNKPIMCTAPVLKDGTELFLGMEEANYLNGQGVITPLNFIGGWKAWGNRTSAYPAITDVKDSFIPIRRMFNWVSNTLILTFWSKIDKPTNRRLIETIVESANMWFNSLVADEYLLGGRVEFLREENPEIDVMDGIIKFNVYLTPPSPARQIDFIQEYDVNYVTSFINSLTA